MHEGTSTVYRIVVRGELSERYAPIFEEMEVKVKSGHTVIIGQVIDQPSLHSIGAHELPIEVQLDDMESVGVFREATKC